MLTYTNPRTSATFTDWPYGQLRTTCTFDIEHNARGERAVRQTINPKTGKACAPKMTTYARLARIVDGSDGRTYIVELSMYGFFSVLKSDFMQQETVHIGDPLFKELSAMFDEVTA